MSINSQVKKNWTHIWSWFSENFSATKGIDWEMDSWKDKSDLSFFIPVNLRYKAKKKYFRFTALLRFDFWFEWIIQKSRK